MEVLRFLLDSSVSTAALLVGVIFFMSAMVISFTLIERKQEDARKKAYWQGRNKGRSNPFAKRKGDQVDFAAEQLKAVTRAKFTSKVLLNKAEANVFRALDAAVITRNPNWQVMAQVCLGEFINGSNKDAHAAINSKRVDFALMDENCCVRHALEYQGNGHHQGSAAARDAVKKEALRKAGIGYHEVVAGHTTPGELKRLVERLVPGI